MKVNLSKRTEDIDIVTVMHCDSTVYQPMAIAIQLTPPSPLSGSPHSAPNGEVSTACWRERCRKACRSGNVLARVKKHGFTVPGPLPRTARLRRLKHQRLLPRAADGAGGMRERGQRLEDVGWIDPGQSFVGRVGYSVMHCLALPSTSKS